jgi:hypothetical protein
MSLTSACAWRVVVVVVGGAIKVTTAVMVLIAPLALRCLLQAGAMVAGVVEIQGAWVAPLLWAQGL